MSKLTDLEKLWELHREEVNFSLSEAIRERVEEMKLYVDYTITEVDEN